MGPAGEDTPFVGDTAVAGPSVRTATALRQREAIWPAEHAVPRAGSDHARVVCPTHRQPCTEIRLGCPEFLGTESASVRGRGSRARRPTRIAIHPRIARPAAARYPRPLSQLAPRRDDGQAPMAPRPGERPRICARSWTAARPPEPLAGPALTVDAAPPILCSGGSGCSCPAAPVATELRRSGPADASLARGSESASCRCSSLRR